MNKPSTLIIHSILSHFIKNLTVPVTGESVMPANAASAQTEKRAMSAAPTRPAQPLPSPSSGEASKVRTRSNADPMSQARSPSKLSEAKKFLTSCHLLPEGSPCTVQAMTAVLRLMAETCKMPDNVSRALGHVSDMLSHTAQQSNTGGNAESLPTLLKEMQMKLSDEMDSRFTALESKLTLPTHAQEKLETTAKELGIVAESIKATTNDIGKSIAQVLDTSSQLANTATSYKDALLKSNEQQAHPRDLESTPQVDPRVTRDVDRKSHQILIDTLDPKIAEMSLAGIKEKVSATMTAITNPPPPKDFIITEVIKLRRGGFTVVFNDKEVIKWLQDEGAELEFTSGIAPDASITKRVYSILVPRVPLTFNPTDDKHLREVEESNNLPAGTLDKARWIKPVYRRTLGQMAAHAIFTLKDVNVTNACIRDGLYVCGVRI